MRDLDQQRLSVYFFSFFFLPLHYSHPKGALGAIITGGLPIVSVGLKISLCCLYYTPQPSVKSAASHFKARFSSLGTVTLPCELMRLQSKEEKIRKMRIGWRKTRNGGV